MDYGPARIDEGVGTLIVQARKSFRSVQIGKIPLSSPGMTLRFMAHSQSARGIWPLLRISQRRQ